MNNDITGYDRISNEDALKIIEDNGFRLGLKVPDEAGYRTNYLFMNDKGDILSASTDESNDPRNIECKIYGVRDTNDFYEADLTQICQIYNKEDGLLYFSIDAHNTDGLFSVYQKIINHGDLVKFDNIENREFLLLNLPIPDYINEKCLKEIKGNENISMIRQIVNLLKIQEYFPQMSDELQSVYHPLVENMYDILLYERNGTFNYNVLLNNLPCIQEKLNLSENEMKVFLDEIEAHLDKTIRGYEEYCENHPDSIKAFRLKTLNKVKQYLSTNKQKIQKNF